MSRVLLQYVVPLLLPTVLYLAWWWAFGRRQSAAGDGQPQQLTEGPWYWLMIGGVVLMAGGLIVTALTGGEAPGGRYVAPHLEDGRVVPGRVVRD
jgi:hypothetical protein